MTNETHRELRLSLIELIGRHLKNLGRFKRADMDEVAMLTEACAVALPKRLIQTVNSFDKNFHDYDEEKFEFLTRSLRILEVAEKLPDREEMPDSSELIPTFTLGDKDKKRVLVLCTGMRKIIFTSTDFDEPHKKRLLNRIAAIEKQVHSPKGLFDVVLGGVSDVGETLGKFGIDVKPLTNRMREVAQITRRGTKEYDQIPAPEEVKKLPPPVEGSTEQD